MITCNATTLLKAASCFSCLPTRKLSAIRTYIFCQLAPIGAGRNIIPVGSKYGGGGTPEFDLTVLANTSYRIMWGANDLSMTLCGVNYPSTGVGTTTAVFTGACTTMQFFGTFAGTSVTAIVVVNRSIIPIPTGVTLVASANGTQAVASWDNPNFLLVTYAELWTSTDNVTFTLAATVNFPTATASVAAPAVGGTLYAKVRWCGPTSPCGAFSASVSLNGRVTDWVRRVVVNGGATPSVSTQTAMATFVNSMVSNSLEASILALNVVAPDNLIAAFTPLYKSTGNDPWTNNAFVAGDLTVNGLQGNSTTKWINTGEPMLASMDNPATTWPGLTVYVASGGGPGNFCESGLRQNILELYSNFTGGLAFFDCWNVATGRISAANNPWTGFFSGNRIDLANSSIFKASSTVPFTTLVTTAANNTGSGHIAGRFIYFFSNQDNAGTPIQFSNRRLSFMCYHFGLTSAKAQAFYNAVQALRVAFGGGFV